VKRARTQPHVSETQKKNPGRKGRDAKEKKSPILSGHNSGRPYDKGSTKKKKPKKIAAKVGETPFKGGGSTKTVAVGVQVRGGAAGGGAGKRGTSMKMTFLKDDLGGAKKKRIQIEKGT